MRKMIDMAEEAGMTGLEDGGLFDNFLVFEALVRADERDDILRMSGSQWFKSQARYDEAIRARDNT